MPRPVPAETHNAAPAVCLNLNVRWANIVSTVLNDLLTRPQWDMDRNGLFMANPAPVWDGDEDAQFFADQQIYAIMAALALGMGNCTEDEEMPPTGAILAFYGTVIPPSYLLCDGSEVNSADYPALAVVMGIDPDVTPTFQLPDLRSRFPLGAGEGFELTNRDLGLYGGEELRILETPNMPAHAHSLAFSSQTVNVESGSTPIDVFDLAGGGATSVEGGPTLPIHGDGSFSIIPPFLTVNFIIRT